MSIIPLLHILIPSNGSRSIKERTIYLNYNYENATPRGRNEGAAFSNGHGHGCHTCDTAERRQTPCGCRVDSHTTGNICKNDNRYTAPYRIRVPAEKRRSVNSACGSCNGYLHREAPIAMVYSPVQQWRDLYDPATALSNGTIFKELDLPFYPTPCRRKECGSCHR